MKLPSLVLKNNSLSNLNEAISREWIITNGLGGYSSSTALCINTRKYHGLLVTALHPPGNRRVCLGKLDEEINIENRVYPLGSNEFEGRVYPKGHTFLREFTVSPFPEFTYSLEDIQVKKTIVMLFEKNATLIRFRIRNKSNLNVKARIFPLINWRHFHSVTDHWKNPPKLESVQTSIGTDIIFKDPKSTLALRATKGQYRPKENWIEKIYYREEAKRGESCLDDCYQPGYFELDVTKGKNNQFTIIAIVEKDHKALQRTLAETPITAQMMDVLHEKENARYNDLLTRFYNAYRGIPKTDWLNWIVLSTDMFNVKSLNPLGKQVIAGYHWFGTWGRDTFISLPGLLLVTRRFEEAKKVLMVYKNHMQKGLIPNFLSNSNGQSAYNTVDATLWYIHSLLQYAKYIGDFCWIQNEIWPSLKESIKNHVNGTSYDIRLDTDGLLMHGPQLTWMDACVENQPVTPRTGKAVEIQALWFNALKIMQTLAGEFNENDKETEYAQMAEKTSENFIEKFWDSENGYLFDTIGTNKDNSLRPNQIIAVSLDFTMLGQEKNEKIVDVVHKKLLTPFGMRTLSRSDPLYKNHYFGDRRIRDHAYHNGTVWPWLLGPFTKAYLKAKGYAEFRREYALKNFLFPLMQSQIKNYGLGTINEIFDGEPPHQPRGCIAQAWSIAEPFRAYVEDILQIEPKYEKSLLNIK